MSCGAAIAVHPVNINGCGCPPYETRSAHLALVPGHGARLHGGKGYKLAEKGLRPIIWSESGFLTLFNAF